jgi:tetratricopeptide (TPR) repeat protein
MLVKQDHEYLTVILSVVFVIAIVAQLASLPEFNAGAAVVRAVQGYHMPGQHPAAAGSATAPTVPSAAMSERQRKVAERFQQAVALLHAQRYEYAITALDEVLSLAPDLPDAYINMGYAFLGLKEYGPARGAFETAINLKVDQANAYYGLAEAFEGVKDYEAALGAMRTYIHLTTPDDPYLTKARAAIWEWQGQLGRIPGVKPAPKGEGISIETEHPKWSGAHEQKK